MNVMGFIRGLMSKNMDNESFFIRVAETVEAQLKEWDENYEVMVMKLKDYEFYVYRGETSCHVSISEQEAAALQDKSPFSLDYKIWRSLEEQGLEVLSGYGDYIDKVYGRFRGD